jgi:DHA1 family multidrug resistance protein-like MFS transporter
MPTTPSRFVPGWLWPAEAWRRNLYVVMLAVFVSFSGFTFVMPFLPLYIKQLGVTDTGDAALWSGVIFGISPLISGLLSPWWGSIAERYGRKLVLQISLLNFVVILVLMALVRDVYQLFILRVLIGALGSISTITMALASTIAPREQVGEAVGLLQATILSSGIAAPFLGGVVVDWVGLRGSFYLAAAFCGAAALVVYFAYHEAAEQGVTAGAASAQRATKRRGQLADYFHLPIFIGLLVAIFITQFVDRSFGPLLPLYLATIGAPESRLGLITGLVGTLGALAGTIAAAMAGRLSSKRQPRPLLLVSLASGALFCLPIAFVGHWGQFLVLRVLLGLFAGGALTLCYAIGGRELPHEVKMGAFSTLAGIGMLGSAISPFASGAIARWTDLRAIFILNGVLYLVLLAWAWFALGRRTAEDAPPEPSTPTPAAADSD